MRVLLAILAAAGCYEPPEPDCAFSCGPGDACPDDYACAADHRCHRNGAPEPVICPTANGSGAAPFVVSTDPHDGASNVPLDVMPSAILTEDVVGITDLTFWLELNNHAVFGHAEYEPSSKQARFVPDIPLDEHVMYTMWIATGVTTVSGEPLPSYHWSFTTGPDVPDTEPPHVSLTIPLDGDTMVVTTASITVGFSEPVQGVSSGTFTVDSGGLVPGTISELDPATYSFTPIASMPPASTITVSVGPGIYDLHGNALIPSSFQFTTSP
jgi:hypothetical protein